MLDLAKLDLDEIATALSDQDEYAVRHTFRDVRATRRAVEWLLNEGLVDEEAGQLFLHEHPEPQLP